MKQNKILKNTLKFMISFILITVLAFILLGVVTFLLPTHGPVTNYIPIRENFNPENLNWENISKVGGEGVLIDSQGNTLKSYNIENPKENYSNGEIVEMVTTNKEISDLSIGSKEKTTLVYNLEKGNRFLLIYPSDVIYTNINLNINRVMGPRANNYFIFLLMILALYLTALYLIVRGLSRSLNIELEKIKKEEEDRKDEFFRGLAHDIKTPLSSVIAQSSALKDKIVPEDKKLDYYNGIYKNGKILSDRIKDMMDLTLISEKGIYNPKSQDILEFVRRYVGENYNWFSEKNATIEILFEDVEKEVVEFDEKLMERLLENILQNSVHHNKKPVEIKIDFDKKNKKLIFSDNGKGVPKEFADKIFDPMVTGNPSRTGEKLRGIGLTNVSRIANLHGWKVYYKDKFILEIK